MDEWSWGTTNQFDCMGPVVMVSRQGALHSCDSVISNHNQSHAEDTVSASGSGKTWLASIISFLNIMDQERTIDEFNQLLDHRSGQQSRRNFKAPAPHSSADLWRNGPGDCPRLLVHAAHHKRFSSSDLWWRWTRWFEWGEHTIFSELFTHDWIPHVRRIWFMPSLRVTEALGTLHVTRWRCCVNIVALSG